ncbi:MAG TPA: DNA polymerase Y family protein, partial [Chryseosolibacter sp.]|nr:DNA polymerase Y family protein [Chryseosolibacter sp.]
MARRFVSIWFRHLVTDWFSLRQPDLLHIPFVLRAPVHGRMVITAVNAQAQSRGVFPGTVLADAKAILPELEVQDDMPGLPEKLLKRIAEWCIRFTPVAAVDPPDGIILDVSGCSHLWGGDTLYVEEIRRKLNGRGYDVRIAMADTPGVAWAVARYGEPPLVVCPGKHRDALLPLPPESLRLESETAELLHKLGLHQVRQFISMPRASLRKRFGPHFILRLDSALG